MTPELARDALVDLGVVDDGVHALGVPALEHAPDLRGAQLELDSDEVVAAGPGGHVQRPPGVRQRDQDDPRLDELLHAACHEPEERLELDLGGERAADLVECLELPQPAGRGLVEASVLDRDRRLGGEELRELLVLGA